MTDGRRRSPDSISIRRTAGEHLATWLFRAGTFLGVVGAIAGVIAVANGHWAGWFMIVVTTFLSLGCFWFGFWCIAREYENTMTLRRRRCPQCHASLHRAPDEGQCARCANPYRMRDVRAAWSDHWGYKADECAGCRYDLTGLPETGHCPECGREY